MNQHTRPRAAKRVAPKVTKTDLERAASFLTAMGAKVAAIDVLPGSLRIITTDGQGLTLSGEDAKVDAELQGMIAKNGEG